MTSWKSFRRFGLTERLLAILLLVATVDFAANTLIFDQATSFALRKDDAARVAENLTLVTRAMERVTPDQRGEAALALSTTRFALEWMPQPLARNESRGGSDALLSQIVTISPELARHELRISPPKNGDSPAIRGTFRLTDGSIVAFRTHSSRTWRIDLMRLLIPTLGLAIVAWALFRLTLRPIRDLVAATRWVGSSPPRAVPENGPDEVRALIRAFNQMQQRIYRSLQDRTQSMLAIGHDLRTPLARLQLQIENAEVDKTTRNALVRDTEEMNHLLASLQAYVDSGAEKAPPEMVDLAVMAATLIDTVADDGADATYAGAEHLEVLAHPVSLRRSLSNLIENALRYAGNARVTVRAENDDAVIEVEDDGPGIPETRMDDVLQPFFRLDSARARSTTGMGLGLPIVRRAVKLEGGSMQLVNRAEGGLKVTIRLPGAIPRA